MSEKPSYIPEEFKYRVEEVAEGLSQEEAEREFSARRVENPNDPAVKEAQGLFENLFSHDEVDDLETLKKAMENKDEPYRLVAIEDENKKLIGAIAGADLRLRNEDGEPLNDRILYLTYLAMSEEYRKSGHGSVGMRWETFKTISDAVEHGEKVSGSIVEAADKAETFYNRLNMNDGMRRLYYQNEQDQFVEVPYRQIPIHWDGKTGKPVSGAVAEHLMYVPLDRSANEINGEDLLAVVRTMHYYNMREEDDFETEKAYQKHEQAVEEYVEDFSEAVGGKTFRLIGKQEREEMMQQGRVFVENKPGKVEK